MLAAGTIATVLFGDDRYRDVIRLLALLQMGIACANFFLAILKWYRDAQGNALAIVGGQPDWAGGVCCLLSAGGATLVRW